MDELLALEGYTPTIYKSVEIVAEDKAAVKQVVREYLGSGVRHRDEVRTYAVCVASSACEKLIDASAVDVILQEMADAGEFAEGYGNSGVVTKPPVEPVEIDPPKPAKPAKVTEVEVEPKGGEVIDVG